MIYKKKNLLEKISKAASYISEKSRKGSANYMILSSKAVTMLNGIRSIIRKEKIKKIFKDG